MLCGTDKPSISSLTGRSLLLSMSLTKKLTKVADIPKKKLSDLFARSNSESVTKKLGKISPGAKQSRVKSVFVAPRHSIWSMYHRMRTKKSNSSASHISPLGLTAMKNQALAGLIPHFVLRFENKSFS